MAGRVLPEEPGGVGRGGPDSPLGRDRGGPRRAPETVLAVRVPTMRLREFAPKSFTQKLRLMIVATPCLVLALTVLAGLLISRWTVEDQVAREALEQLGAATDELDIFLKRFAELPRTIATLQELHGPEPSPAIPPYIVRLLAESPPQVHGLYIAYDDRDRYGSRWLDRVQLAAQKEKADAGPIQYNYKRRGRDSEWYFGARDKPKGQRYITRAYLDANPNGITMVSITQPVFDGRGRRIGVAGVDLSLSQVCQYITREVNLPDVGEAGLPGRRAGRRLGYAYLLDDRGQVIAHPNPLFCLRKGPHGEEIAGKSVLDLPGGEQVVRSTQGSGRASAGPGGAQRLYWLESDQGWKIVLCVPEAVVLAPAWRMAQWSAGFGALSLALMVGIVSRVARRVTGPIPRLTAAAAAVEAGDYRADGLAAIAARRDEFGQLARGFGRMVEEVAAREAQLTAARDELSRSERHFRSLIENASDTITVVEPDGLIRYKSPSVRRVLGYEPEDLAGKPVVDFVHPDDRDAVAAGLRRIVEQPGVAARPVEYRFRHKDGSWRTLEATSTNLLADPAVAGVVVNSRDITERKQAEQEILALNAALEREKAELEQRVRLRTAELHQRLEELAASKEATDQAMKAQEIFLSNVAHDLRTPLTIVIGYSEDLLRRAKKKGLDAFLPDLKLIVNKGRDLLELINDLLNLSKSMNDKSVELDLKPFDVAAMIRGRMEGIGTVAQKYGNTIDFRPEGELGTMVGDEAKVWRVLMNLLTNACKFTKDGRITLDAARLPADDGAGGDRLVFRVTDTGMGMNAEQQARLFHRFAQVHASSGKMQAGVGLGLSICLLYCKAMGGTIEVASEEGHGSAFTVTFPAEVVPASPQPAPAPRPPKGEPRPAAPAGVGNGDGQPRDAANVVLIIDDDASICELLQRNLGDEGYRTRTASTGEEGLRLAKQLLPSAIILDVVMPGIDGWAVLAALKTDAKTADIPIIMASMLDEKQRGFALGADEYVTKPFTRDRLAELLHKHVGGRPSARILVVEDDADTRARLGGTLREQGWHVTEAADGRAALARIEADHPDLILLDLMLPRMDGFELVEEVRRHKSWESIPIVVITGADLDPEARRRLQGRVEQVLQKGLYGRDELLDEVRALVGEHDRGLSPPVSETENADAP
jgi:PAS domain S-box-containing protein